MRLLGLYCPHKWQTRSRLCLVFAGNLNPMLERRGLSNSHRQIAGKTLMNRSYRLESFQISQKFGTLGHWRRLKTLQWVRWARSHWSDPMPFFVSLYQKFPLQVRQALSGVPKTNTASAIQRLFPAEVGWLFLDSRALRRSLRGDFRPVGFPGFHMAVVVNTVLGSHFGGW